MQKSNRTNRLAFLMVLLALALVVAPVSSQAGSYTFNPTDDAYVSLTNPSQTFNNTSLYVGRQSTDILRSFLKFDLSTIPAAEVITGGTLHLYCGNGSNISSLNLDAASPNTWSETTLTWNNQPALGSLLTSFTPTVSSWSNLALPTTTLVHGVFSLGLTLTTESGTTTIYDIFYSSEQTNEDAKKLAPYLTVETTAAPVPLPGGALLLGGGLLRLYASWRRRRD